MNLQNESNREEEIPDSLVEVMIKAKKKDKMDDLSSVVPVRVHIMKDDYGILTSARSDHNIAEVFKEANRIWEQAEIYFEIEDIVMTRVHPSSILKAIYGNSFELYNHENFDSNKINAFFAKSLNGINGFSLGKINSILVADFTTVNDFRTTAHEFGHIFGLTHVEPIDRLMALGRNGETLNPSEVLSARDNALRFLKKITLPRRVS